MFTGPARSKVGPAPAGFHEVTFQAADGPRLSGWLSPARDGQPTAILLHGYRANRLAMLERARWLIHLGYGALLYDARASGESGGSLRSFGYHETNDLLAAIELVRGNVVLFGQSQGGATVLLAAERLPSRVRAVVLESVYDELLHAVDRRFRGILGIPGWLGGALMVPIAEYRLGVSVHEICPVAHPLRCPVLVMCGDRDARVWVGDTQRLFAAAREPKELWMIPGAAHEDLFAYGGQAYRERVQRFLRSNQ